MPHHRPTPPPALPSGAPAGAAPLGNSHHFPPHPGMFAAPIPPPPAPTLASSALGLPGGPAGYVGDSPLLPSECPEWGRELWGGSELESLQSMRAEEFGGSSSHLFPPYPSERWQGGCPLSNVHSAEVKIGGRTFHGTLHLPPITDMYPAYWNYLFWGRSIAILSLFDGGVCLWPPQFEQAI